MPVITAADLRRFAPSADPRIVAAFVAHSDAAFARWGITTAKRLQMFMGQTRVESAGLAVLFENMNYSAARIHAVWPHRFGSAAAAQPYAHNPRRLADKVYGDRIGNRPGTDDGWLCRGQGLLDNTGRDSFDRLAVHMGVTLEDARAQATADDGMVECAAATFHMLGCLPFADRGDIVGCTKRVNGGLIGLADRRAALAAAARVWPSLRAGVATAGPTRAAPSSSSTPDAPSKPIRQAPAAADRPAAAPASPPSWLELLLGLFPSQAA